METREALLEQLNQTVLRLIDLYQNTVDPASAVYEEWSAKEVLGHITFWHESFARNVHDLVNGIRPKPLKGRFRDLNQRCMEKVKTQTVENILERLKSAHQIIGENILNPKLAFIPYKVGSRNYTPEEHLELVVKHIQSHIRDILNTNKK